MDSRTNRDGSVIEELGHYDPLVPDTDARAILDAERVEYWLKVGAKPTESVAALIKKYGKGGTHVEKQQQALERLKLTKPQAPAPWTPPPKPAEEAPAAEAATGEDAPAETAETAAAE
jgi:small subunit ribosomal protein S16